MAVRYRHATVADIPVFLVLWRTADAHPTVTDDPAAQHNRQGDDGVS